MEPPIREMGKKVFIRKVKIQMLSPHRSGGVSKTCALNEEEKRMARPERKGAHTRGRGDGTVGGRKSAGGLWVWGEQGYPSREGARAHPCQRGGAPFTELWRKGSEETSKIGTSPITSVPKTDQCNGVPTPPWFTLNTHTHTPPGSVWPPFGSVGLADSRRFLRVETKKTLPLSPHGPILGRKTRSRM